MIFWDSSALIPLFVKETNSRKMKELLRQDPSLVVWWNTSLECFSAFARLRREKIIGRNQEEELRDWVKRLADHWSEIQPAVEIRTIASQLLLIHKLSAADALQLAAALMWANKTPQGHKLVSLDKALSDAARMEGFSVQPD